MPAHRLGLWGVLLVLGIGWGSTQSLGKIAVSTGHGFFGLIFWQLVVGVLVLGAVQLIRRRGLPLNRQTLAFGALIAMIGTIIPNSTFYISVAHLPAGVMSILISTVPILAFPIALALGMERFSALRLTGLLCGLAGVALIALPQAGLPGGAALAFVPLALVGPLFYAIEGNVVARWGTAGLDPVQAMLAASGIGAVIVLPLTLASGQWIDPTLPWGAPERALVLSSVIHAFMYAGYVWLARTAGAVFASQTSYVVTAAGVGWAMLLLGERFSLLVWLAAAIMVVGLALVQPRPKALTAAA
jgi:drug/metabolite transporter (DMT)-like permease